MPAEILKMDVLRPRPSLLARAAAVLRAGGVIAMPTDTCYGLAVNPCDARALERLYRLKGRDFGKPLLLLIAERKQLADLTSVISPQSRRLMEEFWPGPLTLLLPAAPGWRASRVVAAGKIGVRLPESPLARELVRLAGVPLTSTSANPSGAPAAFDAGRVREYFARELDLIIDGGPSRRRCPSTVLDVSVSPPRLLRAGAIAARRLQAVVPLA